MFSYVHPSNIRDPFRISDSFIDYCSYELFLNEQYAPVGYDTWREMYDFLCGKGQL